jgi:hypothetical protein
MIQKAVNIELPTGETATIAVVKSYREQTDPIYIYDLCKEEQQQEGEPILLTLQQNCYCMVAEAPFTLTTEEEAELKV